MLLKRADKFLIISLLSLALFLFIPNRAFTKRYNSTSITVYKGNEILFKKDLNDDGFYLIKDAEGKMSLQIKDNKVRVADSDCPRKICIQQGWISQPGQVIYCVPNNIMVEIDSKNKQEIDSVLR